MSAKQSILAQYGYDVAVALSQASINATMKEYLFESQLPVVGMYYNKDYDGNPVEVDYATLMTQTSNTDPLKVNSWDSSKPSNKDIDNLSNSNFLCAFKAEIGIPPCFDPGNIPDVINLIPGNAGSVTFNLMCYIFTIVYAKFDGKKMTSYLNQFQPADGAWIFSSNVPLKNVNDATNLPSLVQQQVDSITGDFSVQKLIVDLGSANASYEPAPEIEGVSKGSPVYNALNLFIRAYFNSLKSKGQPVLNYSITQNKTDSSTLKLTDIAMEVNAFVDAGGHPIATPTKEQQDLITLNYLCAANGNALSPPQQLSWNWLDNTTDERDFDGVIAINRDTLMNYFQNQLYSYIFKNSWSLIIKGSGPYDWTLDGTLKTEYQPWELTYADVGTYEFTYSREDYKEDLYGWNGALGDFHARIIQELSLRFTDNKIIITQHLVILIQLNTAMQYAEGRVLDRALTDIYTLKVDENGNLKVELNTPGTPVDNSETPSVNSWLNASSHINDVVARVKKWIDDSVKPNFTNIPLSLMTNFVFPAGRAVVFKNVFFSDYLDLVAHITYADPSTPNS